MSCLVLWISVVTLRFHIHHFAVRFAKFKLKLSEIQDLNYFPGHLCGNDLPPLRDVEKYMFLLGSPAHSWVCKLWHSIAPCSQSKGKVRAILTNHLQNRNEVQSSPKSCLVIRNINQTYCKVGSSKYPKKISKALLYIITVVDLAMFYVAI